MGLQEAREQCLIFFNQGGFKGESQEKRGRIWKCKIWEVGGLPPPPTPCYPLAGIKDMLHVEDLFTYCLFGQLRIVFHFQLQKKKKKKKIDKIFFI